MKVLERMNKLGFLKEKYLFGLVVLLSISPFLGVTFVPSLDGPAHLYNANLILELLSDNDFISKFYSLTNSPNPNLTGHVILSVLLLIFPAFLAEKVMLIFYVIGFSFFFRRLVLVQNPKGVWFSYLGFPIIFSFVFALGFYNFSLGLVFLLWGLYYWIKKETNTLKVSELFALFLLFTLTFFSHVFVFAVFILIVSVRLFFSFFQSPSPISASRKLTEFFLSCSVSLGLFVFYFASRPAAHKSVHNSFSQLAEDIVTLNPLVSYSREGEGIFLALVGCVIIYLIGVTLVSRARGRSKSNLKNDSWLILSILLAVAYFILPDSNSLGGFINTRVALVFYLFIILWIGAQHLSNKLVIPAIIVVVFSHYQLVDYYSHCIKNMNEIAVNCHEMEEFVEENSVVIPLNYSDNWVTGHFSNYLGIEKPLVILDNYEAINDYFATRWKWDFLDEDLYSHMSINDFKCLGKSSYLNQEQMGKVYLLILGNIDNSTDSCGKEKKEELSKYFYPIAKNKHCSLYKERES